MARNPFEGLTRSEMQTVWDEGLMPFLQALHEGEKKATAEARSSRGGSFFGALLGWAILAGLAYGAWHLFGG